MRHWRKATMVMFMLAALLVAGTIVSHQVFAQHEDVATTLNAAQAAQAQALKMYNDMMVQMHATSQMPMSANEKAMMKTMELMGATIKNLITVNARLIEISHDLSQR